MTEQFFALREHGTSVAREILAGITTFLTMAYILVVQPAVLSTDFSVPPQPTGLDAGAVLLGTCIASAFACLLMGILARLPIALAPGMGTNFFFVSVVMSLTAQQNDGLAWQRALAIVFLSGILFLLLTVVGLRSAVLNAMSRSMRQAIAVGIGLFIALLGLKNSGVVHAAPTLVELNAGELLSTDSAVFWSGLVVTLALMIRRTPGSILVGMIVSGTIAAATGRIQVQEVLGLPSVNQSAFLQMNFTGLISLSSLTYIVVFLFMDVFDTTGTLIGITQQAGLTRDGQVSRMNQAMLADSIGTIIGATVGTSTVTSYIESAAGVQQGGRTGLVAITVGLLFLASIFFSPLIIALGMYPPITAPALVSVGAMMFQAISKIDWSDETEAIPAFFVIVGIPLFFSIADGIALGLILWPLLKTAKGCIREVPKGSWMLAAVLIIYFVAVRSQL